MNSNSDHPLGEVIREFLRTYHLEDKINESKVIRSWGKVVGKMADVHTKNIYIRNRILYVKLDSPSLRNELSYSKEKIVSALNAEVNHLVIDDVVFS